MKASDNTTRNRNLSAERENGERTNEKVVAEREMLKSFLLVGANNFIKSFFFFFGFSLNLIRFYKEQKKPSFPCPRRVEFVGFFRNVQLLIFLLLFSSSSQCSIGETQFRNLSMEAQTDSAFNPQLLLD